MADLHSLLQAITEITFNRILQIFWNRIPYDKYCKYNISKASVSMPPNGDLW